MEWESAERVQKNDAGEYRALIGGEWIPVERAQKSDVGAFRVMRKTTAPEGKSVKPVEFGIPQPIVDVAAGASDLMRGSANLLSPGLGEKIWPKSVSQDSGWRTAGQFLDPVAWTIGGGAAKVLPYVPVLGRGAVEGVKATLRNLTGGAATGAAVGALSDEGTAGTGAGIGAAANVVLPPAVAGVVKVGGKIVDAAKGMLGKVRAGEVVRDVAGADTPAIRAALSAAPDDVTAAQAAQGVGSDVFSALGEHVSQHDRSAFYARLLERQKQERVAAMRALAGGATQTESRARAEASKSALNRITGPMREAELGAANTAGTIGARLQQEAEALAEAASAKVADVRRYGRAGEIAAETGQSGRMRLDAGAPPIAGLPRVSNRYSYGEELSQLADRISDAPAAASLILGQARRFKEMQLQSLSAHGLSPLNGASIVGALNRRLADPRIGAEELNARVLEKVRDRIAEWTNAGGVIDASALYGIRKSSVNDAIEQLMGAADPKAKAQRAAGILKNVKPLIDDAIERAGGTGWRNYLRTFEDGMHQIDQQRMGAKALELLQDSPKKFEKLAAGDSPKVVEKIFQTEYDLAKAMGPGKDAVIQKTASEVTRERLLKEQAARGKPALSDILSEHESTRWRLPALFTREATVANKLLGELEQRLDKQTFTALNAAMRSGKSAIEAMNVLPADRRNRIIRAIVDADTAQYLTAPLAAGSQK